ncbi:hypothetical protein YPPY13_3386, partial [Yersinia pestis PY-13]
MGISYQYRRHPSGR